MDELIKELREAVAQAERAPVPVLSVDLHLSLTEAKQALAEYDHAGQPPELPKDFAA